MRDSKIVTDCRCGERHTVREGYDICPYFYQRVKIIAQKHGIPAELILRSGVWKENVSDRELGLVE